MVKLSYNCLLSSRQKLIFVAFKFMKYKKNKAKNNISPAGKILAVQNGFTLIELIVSISIIAMMSGLFLANYHSTNESTELKMTAQKLASDIRLVQNYSLGSKEYGGNMPAGGWGIHLDRVSFPNSYILFADSDGNMQYDSGESDADKGGQTISLPVGVNVGDIDIGSSVNSVDITFLPPDPITNIWDGSNAYNFVDIILIEENGNMTRTVGVNFFGLIEEKE
jgi:prepilin-type N-terminal cleavage/methylation domain-containing protein